MTDKGVTLQTQVRLTAIRLANGALCDAIERAVSQHRGRQWKLRYAKDMTEFACHHAAILSDGAYPVFAKLSEAENGREQFEVELAGLRLLATRAGVLTPTPIGIVVVDGGSVLILEAVGAVERLSNHWRGIGHALARIHMIKGDRFGLESHGYWGPLHQDNTPASDWPLFYTERRLWPNLRSAIESGNLPSTLIPQVEKLIVRFPDLCGPTVKPTLLHGDAQQNNFISTERGAVVIDPAVYYGNPEVDLAAVGIFQPAPRELFEGYQEEMHIDSGFRERCGLWRVCGYLAGVSVEGRAYVEPLSRVLRAYV